MQDCLLSCMLVATPALAEGKNDPFMKCDFEDGRVVVLSEDGDSLIWNEDDQPHPANSYVPASHTPTRVIHKYSPDYGVESLTLFTGWFASGQPDIAPGTALVSRTVVTQQGRLETRSTNGFCVEYIG